MEDETRSSELWHLLKGILAKAREQRLAYLLSQCGLGPREICKCAHRSGVLGLKSLVCGAPSWSG
jgi:hypothetical protein